jgi:hypothetical protein
VNSIIFGTGKLQIRYRRDVTRISPDQEYPKIKYIFQYFSGDSDWIRTNNLPLRRGLLYPVEPLSHA